MATFPGNDAGSSTTVYNSYPLTGTSNGDITIPLGVTPEEEIVPTAEVTETEMSRWTPVEIRLVNATPAEVFINYTAGNNRFVVYDPTLAADERWHRAFRERSTIVADGGEYVASILPNGGWWNEQFNLTCVKGEEMEAP